MAIVYPHLPHYRYGVFSELDQRLEEVLFVTGGDSRDGSIETTPPRSFSHEALVRNRWWGRFLWQQGLGKVLDDFDATAVVFLGDFAHLSTWVQAARCRVRGRRVLFWTIGWHQPESGVRKQVRKIFYRLAHVLLLYGNHGRALGVRAGYPANRMRVIYNSYQSRVVNSQTSASNDSLPSGDRPVIGAVVRLSSSKGLDQIIKAAADLKNKHSIDVDCLIVGEGDERAGLEDVAASLGVRLFLPGAMYSEGELQDVYRRLTVTVIPRAAGLTVLQSLGAGTPVVTIANPFEQMPEFEAITDGVNGSLVEQADGQHLATACATWIERTQLDPERVAQDCRAAVVWNWSSHRQASAIIRELVPGAQRPNQI
ncbi:glycosyltransferase family 4 protein [Nocardioides sp. 1609]|uniref:glycosyltransferase family 4 protein n=1 Tax=Nocardioides sp. 1609 TaxID=2508327 RepID=UPI001431BE5B|nr:glycosyltransferase family 4 protein [Nocardioides sp. 1609]